MKNNTLHIGCVVVEWDRLVLMNMNGKPVGTTKLLRKAAQDNDNEEESEEQTQVFVMKGKKEVPILFEPGQTFQVTTKQVQVWLVLFSYCSPTPCCLLGNQVAKQTSQIVEPISAEDFKNGTFFMKQFSGVQIRKKAQEIAEAAAPAAVKKAITIDGPR